MVMKGIVWKRPWPAMLMISLLAGGCEREERIFDTPPSEVPAPPKINITSISLTPAVDPSEAGRKYERSAYQLSQGKQLFRVFNCVGCHSAGGGGMGPALMDNHWIYGSSIENVFESVSQGRPNGMPSFRNKATTEEIWQLAAYVRSLAALVPRDAAPSRDDGMWPHSAENRLPRTHPDDSNERIDRGD
jgi:cytochrome c oxidase cbb3-type subunit 3